MSSRRALLIGAAQYGEGFAPLPAVATDLEIVDRALTYCGYQVRLLPEPVVRSTTDLVNAIEAFCDQCQRDDIHIIFFSGHGMLLDGEDCIIPAGADYGRVIRRDDLRVATDLSGSLKPDHGLVVFVIDACRSPGHQRVTKSGSVWGDHSRIKAPADHRFVRLFGCSSEQVCHVLEKGDDGRPVSVFSKALSDTLTGGQSTTLKGSLAEIQRRCQQLAAEAHLELQTPRLSYGETSADTDSLLGSAIFDSDPQAAMPTLWNAFDPGKLQCLVIVSEQETKTPPSWTLDELLAAGLAETGQLSGDQQHTNPRIWDAFRQCWGGAAIVSGATRDLPALFEPALVRQATLPINKALSSPAALREAVRGVVEADLVVFDVTGFEPGVMLLLGVRAACRRGVTLCSHGSGWLEGQPLELPFNLQDLSVGSHTPRVIGPGGNPVVVRFVDRVVNGFLHLSYQPRYVDLPAYDALRHLGSDLTATSLIATSSRILVLCPYEQKFFQSWEFLAMRLSDVLTRRHNLRPQIARVIDLASTRLVSQAIYEQARRAAACVVDWSGYTPSVFVEFGVRQAVSEWGAVSIIDSHFADRSDYPLAKVRAKLDQVAQLRTLFAPIEYSLQNQQRQAFDSIARAVVERNPYLGNDQELSMIHDAAWRAIGTVQRPFPSVFSELIEAANALAHTDRDRKQPSQILFHEASSLKSNSEDAALERRIAAWLYLSRRENAGSLADDDPRKKTFRDLGIATAAALYVRGRPGDLELALDIGKLIPMGSTLEELRQQAALERKRGDAYRKTERETEAIQAFQAGVAQLAKGLDILDRARWPEVRDLAIQRAEILGSLAGLHRRLNQEDEAYGRYADGARIERDFQLPTTYNRVNEIKHSLLIGKASVAEIQDRSRDTAATLLAALSHPKSQQLGDDGWAWADLGDCSGFIGELTEAGRAYATFIAKAGVAAPASTLKVLQQIADALNTLQDPDRARITGTMAALRSEMAIAASAGRR